LLPEKIVVSGEDALEIAEALNSTTLRMLQILSQERLDVSTIATRLELSEAYISQLVRTLEDLKLIRVSYERGKRGIRKVCESAVKAITIVIKPEDR
jgi:predicted transcriptional regulator